MSSSSSSSSSVDVPDELRCPISCELFQDPVLAADGFNYEREHIETWFAEHSTSPKTNAVLESTMLTPNHELRARCEEWKALHSTEDGFKKQLKAFSAELMIAENGKGALAAVQSICDLVELARSRDCLILGPAGVAKLLKRAQVLEIVDDHVLAAFTVLQSQCASHVGDCHKEYAKLQSWRSVSLAALQAVDGSDAAFKRDLAKLEKKEAAAKRKEVAAKKKLDAAQAAWEKTKSEVKSVLEEKGDVEGRLAVML